MTKFVHLPVLTEEVLDVLEPRPGEIFVDATIGLGGHARLLLQRLGDKGKLIGIDQDEHALQSTSQNLERYQSQLVLVCGNFRRLDELVKNTGHPRVDGILFDLGVSSLQLEDSTRGFSFNKSERLDMRMSADTDLTAEEVVNSYTREKLTRIFWEYGNESRSRIIAKRIVEARKQQRITSVAELLKIIGGSHGRIHPATKVFQALRIEVNDELNALAEALPQAVGLLAPGGRLAVISFHSLEDRIVKNYFKKLKSGGSGKLLTKKAVTPSWEERQKNPRARSAKLRAIQKINSEAQNPEP